MRAGTLETDLNLKELLISGKEKDNERMSQNENTGEETQRLLSENKALKQASRGLL